MTAPSFSQFDQIRKLSSEISHARKKHPQKVWRLVKRIELEKILIYLDRWPEHRPLDREKVVDMLLDWQEGNALFPHKERPKK